MLFVCSSASCFIFKSVPLFLFLHYTNTCANETKSLYWYRGRHRGKQVRFLVSDNEKPVDMYSRSSFTNFQVDDFWCFTFPPFKSNVSTIDVLPIWAVKCSKTYFLSFPFPVDLISWLSVSDIQFLPTVKSCWWDFTINSKCYFHQGSVYML